MDDRRVVLAVISLALATWVVTAHHQALVAAETCHRMRCVHCPQCNTCCQLKVKNAQEEKHCWSVECQEICVPRVVYPWQRRCEDPTINNKAWVKTVRVLKRHSFECPTCQYEWTPVKTTCGGTTSEDGGSVGDATRSTRWGEEKWPDEQAPQFPVVSSAGRIDLGLRSAPTPTASELSITTKKERLVSFKNLKRLFLPAN